MLNPQQIMAGHHIQVRFFNQQEKNNESFYRIIGKNSKY